MKKLLVLMLVLGMASLANAGLVLNPTSIIVDEGLSAPVAISTDAAISSGVGEQYLLLVGPAGISITADVATAISGDCFIMNAADAGVAGPGGQDGVYGGVFNFGATYVAGSTIFDGITVTGLTAGQYVATLYNVDFDGVTITGTAGEIAVTVTPEPATLAILGLGALLLRRK
jgi:hypothetical protein